ncbi:MAG: hypothetical protein QNJ68_20425 [Microcoleaceae cyanobacterium MO_207.B10]|nr:hypothetical protein [Microcoleaceae cyanobacterium MO_207.B10]
MSEFDDIFQQINQNNQDRNQLKSAVRSANFDSIADLLFKVASQFLGRSVPALRKNSWLRWAIEDLVPTVYHFIKDNWSLFFPYS